MLERVRRGLLQWGLAAGMLALVAAIGHVPIGAPPAEAVIRIIGRMVGEKVRICRDLTPEEIAKVPKHMQAAGQKCDQTILRYHLNVHVDNVQTVDLTVSPAGIRGDRPVYVHRDIEVPPGTHQLRLQFEPEAKPPAGAQSSVPPEAFMAAVRAGTRYPLERTLDLRAGMIVLVELNEQTRSWDVRGDVP